MAEAHDQECEAWFTESPIHATENILEAKDSKGSTHDMNVCGLKVCWQLFSSFSVFHCII